LWDILWPLLGPLDPSFVDGLEAEARSIPLPLMPHLFWTQSALRFFISLLRLRVLDKSIMERTLTAMSKGLGVAIRGGIGCPPQHSSDAESPSLASSCIKILHQPFLRLGIVDTSLGERTLADVSG